MAEHAPKGGGLELWLARTIQQGSLKDLPLYFPMGERVGQHPEQYARALLMGLRESGSDTRTRERTRDNGRAFRSWAESSPLTLDLRSVC
jgi:hypothetical protein